MVGGEHVDQRRAQQEGARQLGVLRGAAQIIVVFRPHRRILLRQQPLVAHGLRLRVLHGDVPALALTGLASQPDAEGEECAIARGPY